MKRRRLRLRTRMVITIMAGVSLVSAVLAGLAFYETSQHVVEASQVALFNLAEVKAEELAREFSLVAQKANGLANAMEVFLPKDKDLLRRLIRHQLVEPPRAYGMAVAYAPNRVPWGGTLYAPYFYRSPKGIKEVDLARDAYNYPVQDWFIVPSLLRRAVWSEPYFDEGGGNVLMTTYSSPVIHDGDFVGVTGVDVSLAQLNRDINRLVVGRKGWAFVLSANGTFLAAPNPEWVMRESIFSLAERLNRPDLRETGRHMIRGGSGVKKIIDFSQGTSVYLAYTKVAQVGWSFGVVMPESEVLDPAMRMAKHQGLLGLAGVVILALVVLLLSVSLTRPLQRLAAGAYRLAQGDLSSKVVDVPPGDEVGDLAESFNHMVDELNHYVDELTLATAARERIEAELNLASQIQESILPRTYPAFPDRPEFDLFGRTVPAREVGGDFYDFFMVDDERVALVMADVSGKGVPAALFMTVTRTLIKNAASHHKEPAATLREVNAQIVPDNDMMMFVTVFYGLYNIKTGNLKYTLAGHPAPLVRRADGRASQLEQLPGTALGVFEDIPLAERETVLSVGEVLLAFTDGLDEADNPAGEMFGIDRAARWLENVPVQSALDLVNDLGETHHSFTGDKEQFDDLTLLILRREE